MAQKEKRGRGRPRALDANGNPANPRERQVVFYLTDEDAAFYSEYTEKLGFKSRSEFFTAIAERLLIGRFAPMVFLKLGLQLGKQSDKVGARDQAGFYFGVRPLPPLPVEEPTQAEWEEVLDDIETAMKTT